jgi:spermidine/putrescine transport system substrate-binding protein
VANQDEQLRLLVPRSFAQQISRRQFLGMSAAGAAALTLAACGGSSSGSKAKGSLEGTLNIYTWAEYQSPDNVKGFSKDSDVKVKLDIYGSNEEALAKLELGGGSGYDILVPTGAFIPLFTSKNLLQPLDMSKIPNFKNLDPAFLDQPWDPGNKYSVVKDWGSTGYVYDAKVIKDNPKDWADFFRLAASAGVSGNVSVLEAPGDVTGLVFWRDGIDWNTEKKEDLDHAEAVLLKELVPHIKAFDSYPAAAMLEGSYVLSQAWNGDARVAVIEDPERYKWVLGGPKTELWVDTWTVLADAKHPDAAHAWINYVLDPKNSAREIETHGYNTAVKGTETELPKDLKGRDIIFFTDEQVTRLVAGEVNSAQDRLVEIFNKIKAAAGK